VTVSHGQPDRPPSATTTVIDMIRYLRRGVPDVDRGCRRPAGARRDVRGEAALIVDLGMSTQWRSVGWRIGGYGRRGSTARRVLPPAVYVNDDGRQVTGTDA
jgi:hypothetical protein